MNPLHKKLLLVFSALLALQTLVLLVKYFIDIGSDGRFGGDFMSFWRAAQRVRAGTIGAIYDAETWRALIASGGQKQIAWFVYPPFALFGLWPFGNLSYGEAVLIWSLLPLPFYFVLVVLLTRRAERRHARDNGTKLGPDLGLHVLLAASALPFLTANLFTGQTGAFLAVFFLAAAYWWNERPILAGIAIGLLAIKPQIGVLIPFALIAAGQWRTIAAAAVTVMALAGAATLWLGLGIWGEYLAMTQLFAEFVGQGYSGIRRLALGPYVSLLAVGLPVALAGLVYIGCLVMATATVVRAFRGRPALGDTQDDLRLGLLAAGTLLATPYSLSYDTPLLILAVIPVVVRAWYEGCDLLELLALTGLLALPFVQPMAVGWHVPYGFAALCLWFFVLYRRYGSAVAALPMARPQIPVAP